LLPSTISTITVASVGFLVVCEAGDALDVQLSLLLLLPMHLLLLLLLGVVTAVASTVVAVVTNWSVIVIAHYR
jgi:hypothetical protein